MNDYHLYVKNFVRKNMIYLKCRTDKCKSTCHIKDGILIMGCKSAHTHKNSVKVVATAIRRFIVRHKINDNSSYTYEAC